ncbi:aquaporin family protein [Lactobacillus sp. LC28-10]|uniref:Aquaporin family protein n=1 Tax=Secundilactobacillus angelensis TaxID=2722706 RepID=A0ABX1KWE9_9LACO|nr:D/L-lactic acid transporter LarD [Secundilactobacillus angelensis]MCH5461634.1 aquaporin family protein [Secundilactobacillus angelensis]NLR17929.1 aquaporin family protein [Secundilactobacillus angelensis]
MHQLMAEFMGTALMILFGVGVHAGTVLHDTKYHGSGHLFAITTWAFGISIALFIFGNVTINPAMAFCMFLLGKMNFITFIETSIFQIAGGIVGAVVVYVMYADSFKKSYDKIDPVTIRNIFSTSPAVRNLPRNFFVEFIDTFIFLTSILAISRANSPEVVPIGVGLLVWAIGMGLGGPTGFAMNQARDLGPRIAHAILPIQNKAESDWQYGLLVPGIAPFFGAVATALFAKFYLGI